ncbi:phosphate/phosphite/phosphonate ABC transporter periplasmic binding protein [Oleiphilus messinensis]|uniref:Phosphate/phosphite/phosphonate ABC transporter periplasmic binding protein n=1 Tax=Oleiphilus messinensis TaxID=141451 RepID=A0A1Y0I1R4_9GAMM|nr:phosphate/phosphite/phosphonate ABC transporter substrate-binding protein [Oleiphilus messinensis]ARU54407.1 phosphate/phosphite/phosphonate ABC transporter periplasmic binding protein [Oleiphilus messinensis]
MESRLNIVSVFVIVCVSLITSKTQAHDKSESAKPFCFSAIPSNSTEWTQIRYHRLENYFQNKLQLPVCFIPVSTYEETVDLFRSGKIHLGWFGGVTGIQARESVPDSQVLAQGFEDQFFKSLLIAHHSTGLKYSTQFPEHTNKMTLLFGPQASTSGHIMPLYFMRHLGNFALDNQFKSIGNSHNHVDTIAKINNHEFDLGFVNYTVWFSELQSNNVDPRKVKIIWESPGYPDYHWLLSGNAIRLFGTSFPEKLRHIILDMNADAGLISIFRRSHFIRGQNSDYNDLQSIVHQLESENILTRATD